MSTLRGTTHVFPLTSYGGSVGIRTHLSSHVVNRQSRFHRSAGLLADGRNSPETVTSSAPTATPNPRLPPFPHPTPSWFLVVCSRRVVVVSFQEKLAILDAGSLEERKAVLTCYPVSGPNPNPIALGARWLAYADRKINGNALSAGGAESFSGQSVAATVLHAAKSLGKVVASSLTGQKQQGTSSGLNPGIVTVMDVNTALVQEEGSSQVLYLQCDIHLYFLIFTSIFFSL